MRAAVKRMGERKAVTDTRAAVYLSVITLLVALAGWLGRWAIDNVPPPSDWLTWSMIVFGAAGVAGVATGWVLALRAMRERRGQWLTRAAQAVQASVFALLLSALCYSRATSDQCIEVTNPPQGQSVSHVAAF